MTTLRRFSVSWAPLLLVGACAQLIGLGDYEKGEEPNASDGGHGNDGSGGTPSGAKGGMEQAGDGSGGTAGVVAGRGGRPSTGGTGGMGGEGAADTDGGTDSGGTTGGTGRGGSAGSVQGGTGGSGGQGGSGGRAGSSGQAGMGAAGGGGGSPPCTEVTVTELIDQVIDRSGETHLVSYVFEINPGIGLASMQDRLEIQFWNGADYDGILTGMFPLGTGFEGNNSTCSRCFLGYQDPDASASLRKIFFQTGGTFTIDADSQQMDGFPDFTYADVTLREAVIDPNDFHSTIVPGGLCLHLTSGSFSLPPQWSCDATWLGDGECDCGCGVKDTDCTSDESATCDYCWCDESGDCTGFESPTKNWMCL
jgi:hypothetical protein